ncbi:chromosomal replication initiator protein DnaA [Ructibacterium gallinarum]|uniref:Chromosomal replication initiator protein DnaA n=1 Tax=Ructibacterium gallinarum TaxID=2779355 RepID=A0A9D5LY94_9FIRM|nr:chromosomal replication initiator protein DnaA [Ructibacterium gallinarum]MBE5040203.1 chromosomal replication initiator protein DnaA [Ructibacterium gallinarum]
MDQLTTIWKQVLNELAQEISSVSFDTWIKPIRPIALTETHIRLAVPGSLNKNMLMTKFRSLLESCIELAAGHPCEIEVICDTPDSSDKENTDPIREQNFLNPKYSFESFVVGNNNNLAHAASLAVAESPSQKYNPLFIYGGSGLGKTHLLQAIGNYFLKNYPDKKILYTTSEKFTYELVIAIREKTNQDFRNKHRTVDLLLMDDIQFLATKELAQEEFFHTFNTLFEAGKQIVLTSDRLPSETPHLADRLKGRFQMGLLADIQPPDYETRLAILRSKIEEEYFTFDEEIVEYVANNIKSNVRDLEGAVKRILAYAGIERTNTISMELAQKALKEILSTLPQRDITIGVIIDEVEKYFRLPSGSLVTKRRSNDIAYPRHIAMYLAREVLDESYPRIGEEFHRDHSTVMTAVKKIRQNLSGDTELNATIRELVENIKKN